MSVRDVEKAIISVQPIIEGYYDQDADPTEKETRQRIIDPILDALGWSARKNCLREYYVTEDMGHRVDYAMFTENGDPTIIVGAKRFSKHTRDLKNVRQTLDYADISDAEAVTVVVTNGEFWNIAELKQRGEGVMMALEIQNPIGLLWAGATVTEQSQRLYDALSYDKHWKLTNRGGGMRRWRGPQRP